MITSQLKKAVIRLRSFFFIPFYRYINIFKTNIGNAMVLEFDKTQNNFMIFVRSSRGVINFDTHNAVFDRALISMLSQNDAVLLGYYFGVNYDRMLNKLNKKTYDYSICNALWSRCSIISMDRRRYIQFSINGNLILMSPSQIIKQKALLNEFHPVQACYIGIQAGLLAKNNLPHSYS